MNFDYDGGGIGKGGMATILVNGKKVASGRIEHTQGMIFSADETAGVGMDDATPVTTDYKERDNVVHGQDPQGHRGCEADRHCGQGGGRRRPAHGGGEGSAVQLDD